MKAVILAGGLGNRLKPLTDNIPKPLLPIGEKSILEIQIKRLYGQGFSKIFVATYYKADYVESFIGDGRRHGLEITFSKEKTPLGTCGPLSLLRKELNEPFILMNGDILTTIDFQKLYRFGLDQSSDLTVVTKKIRTPFNFGSVTAKDNLIVDIEEKPDLELEILAGIYFLKPAILEHIPDGKYFGIDNLIKKLLAGSLPVSRYLMKEYWLDIGSMDSYNEAQEAYEEHFKEKR
ncbi:MAG: NTP transferase domain-containing protein [Candidatus Aminicenantes bacterium]|nr:NTP transferase domain-containing protein [Candidatus Aminicenantes bacterium]